MSIMKARIEADKKKAGSVVGKIFAGPSAGKIVFFNNKNKPAVGQVVLIEEFDDRGRFMIALKWSVQTTDDTDKVLAKAMEGRLAMSKGNDFKVYTRGLLDHQGGRVEYAMNAYVEIPLRCLENGLKGDGKLMEMYETFYNNISGNPDMVSEATVRFLDAARGVFEKGDGPRQIMDLRSFDELYEIINDLVRHPGKWPQRVLLGELTANGRSVLPLD